MQAMILAGGLGSRLRPLTNDVPKPMLLVKGKPILYYVVENLKKHGFDDIIINVAYKKEVIIDYFNNDLKESVSFVVEKDVSGSAGALLKAKSFFKDENFLVVNGDVICDFDLAELWNFHLSYNALATLSLYEKENVEQFGVVLTSRESKIEAFQEKPAFGTEISHNINAGIYVFNKNIFNIIQPKDGVNDLSKDVFPFLISKRFYGFNFDKTYNWRDIGSIQELEAANK